MTLITPPWFTELLNIDMPTEAGAVEIHGQRFLCRGGILRSERLLSEAQKQTGKAFGFKWHKRETFESDTALERARDWLRQRYGDVAKADWIAGDGAQPIVLDAGCGGAMSALELFAPVFDRIRYLGVDVSTAVEIAAKRLSERGKEGAFIQADLMALPLGERSVDIIFSEGVLHHTDSTEGALKKLAPLLKPGGRFLFYVYKKKGPIREFTDDFIREQLQALAPEDAWEALKPLTRLGQVLGDMKVDVDIREPIDLLGIPAGRIDLQRFIYWNMIKAFYRPDYTFDEMHHINFDWYAPKNAHRQSPEEVRRWCTEAGLVIEREVVEEAGITIVARKESY